MALNIHEKCTVQILFNNGTTNFQNLIKFSNNFRLPFQQLPYIIVRLFFDGVPSVPDFASDQINNLTEIERHLCTSAFFDLNSINPSDWNSGDYTETSFLYRELLGKSLDQDVLNISSLSVEATQQSILTAVTPLSLEATQQSILTAVTPLSLEATQLNVLNGLTLLESSNQLINASVLSSDINSKADNSSSLAELVNIKNDLSSVPNFNINNLVKLDILGIKLDNVKDAINASFTPFYPFRPFGEQNFTLNAYGGEYTSTFTATYTLLKSISLNPSSNFDLSNYIVIRITDADGLGGTKILRYTPNGSTDTKEFVFDSPLKYYGMIIKTWSITQNSTNTLCGINYRFEDFV